MDLVLNYEVDKLQYLTIGQEGENNATIIHIDMSSWVDALTERGYENICCHLLFKPYNATVPVEVGEWDRDTNILTWEVTTAATAVAGLGYTEIRTFNHPDEGMLLKKSKCIPTMVNDSVSGVDGGTPPAPYDDWINQILILEDQLNQALNGATYSYAVSDDPDVKPDDDDFDPDMPSISTLKGRYLWTRTTISWSTGGNTKLDAMAYIGEDGSGAISSVNGQTGIVLLRGGDIAMSSTDSTTIKTAIDSKLDASKIVYGSEPLSPVEGMIWLKPKAVN